MPCVHKILFDFQVKQELLSAQKELFLAGKQLNATHNLHTVTFRRRFNMEGGCYKEILVKSLFKFVSGYP